MSAVSYLNKIVQEHIGEWVVVVSRDAAILGLCRHTDPPNSSIRRHIPNTSLNVFGVSGVTGQWTLERCGDVNHLKGPRLGQRDLGVTTNKCSCSLAHAVTRFSTTLSFVWHLSAKMKD
ncbi:hypothetical protein BDA96_05G010400 [Sorghum bicolor]|uniref:Uncharacterized protein n=1 Tax=Sorghum bicolor TaxID=4558 RepID=A0A921QW97_SORBI|nr:hypothetical protein BDA96_05G010400 [Sorghum bicolor]